MVERLYVLLITCFIFVPRRFQEVSQTVFVPRTFREFSQAVGARVRVPSSGGRGSAAAIRRYAQPNLTLTLTLVPTPNPDRNTRLVLCDAKLIVDFFGVACGEWPKSAWKAPRVFAAIYSSRFCYCCRYVPTAFLEVVYPWCTRPRRKVFGKELKIRNQPFLSKLDLPSRTRIIYALYSTGFSRPNGC